jgi:4Fe-4S single cluster domain
MLMSNVDLLALQRRGERHIGLSMTAACPMTCSHCAAATVPARDHGKVSLTSAQIAAFCEEMPQLAARGIQRISLTGGEPILALGAVSDLSSAAQMAGINTTIVTGIYWGTTDASRLKIIKALPNVECWNISWDRFHAKHVRLEHVVATARAIIDAGARVTLRVAVTELPDCHADLLVKELPGVDIAIQPVRPVGRAATSNFSGSGGLNSPLWPCLSTGPLVMPDGSARPCCSSMIDEPNHPFAAKTAQHGLVALHDAWLTDPLLLMIRAVGFRPILHLLRQVAPKHELLSGTSSHPCDVCAAIFRDPLVAKKIAHKVQNQKLAAKARLAAQQIFQEPEITKELAHADSC